MISLRAYARHRGCTLSAVQRAISDDRLRQSVVHTERGPKIGDPALADREWADNTLASRVSFATRIRKGELEPLSAEDQALRDRADRQVKHWRLKRAEILGRCRD